MTNEDQERMKRARLRVFSEGVQIWGVDGTDDQYVSPSRSNVGIAYAITVTEDGPQCTCPAALYHRACKHAAAVAMLLEVIGRA